MATYWQGNKKVSKSQYDATQAKNAAWSSPKVVDAPTTTRQPSGKQPDSDQFPHLNQGSPYANTGKQPDSDQFPHLNQGSPYNTGDYDKNFLRRLQEEADRKRMQEQFEAAATHGKEYVFEFSKPITSKVDTYVSRLVKLLGGKRSYIEDQTKLVVVM